MIIATLATNLAYNDLKVFFNSLALWNKTDYPKVYLYADDNLEDIDYPGIIVRSNVLNKYTSFNRAKMEKMPSEKYSSLWLEFQAEKLNLLDWVFDSEPAAREDGVFYFDADICFFGPLPQIPKTAIVGLSPHMICNEDVARFGKYNAGFLWVKTRGAIETWRQACPTSRFFEQAALECFDKPEWAGVVHTFPIQYNYGWWRLWQGTNSSKELMAEWSMQRSAKHSGILVQDEPLCSVHTHWSERFDRATYTFNSFIIKRLEILAPFHGPAQKMLEIVSV
jgi:hypothetical protein